MCWLWTVLWRNIGYNLSKGGRKWALELRKGWSNGVWFQSKHFTKDTKTWIRKCSQCFTARWRFSMCSNSRRALYNIEFWWVNMTLNVRQVQNKITCSIHKHITPHIFWVLYLKFEGMGDTYWNLLFCSIFFIYIGLIYVYSTTKEVSGWSNHCLLKSIWSTKLR